MLSFNRKPEKAALENKKSKKSALDTSVVEKQVLKSSVVSFTRGLMNTAFGCLTCTSIGPRKAAEKIKLAGKEQAAYGKAVSPSGAFPPLPQRTAVAWERRDKNEPKSSEECEDHQTELNVETDPDI